MATPFRLKRSAVTGKRPSIDDMQIGELAINFYDGHLFAERDTQGVGIGTTVTLLTPWVENFGGGSINYNGIVTATTYYGNQVIGTPAGGFKSGAFTISDTDHTKDSINELNFILGKLVPPAPTTFNNLSLTIQTNAGSRRFCAGFTPTNNTGGLVPSAGAMYARNTDSTVSTATIHDVGPGDNGTVIGYVNATNVGNITLDTNVNNGTNGALVISDNKDASLSTRDSGIDAEFYQVYDVRLLNAASPDGFNKAYINHGSANTLEVFWYEDPSTVSAPVISFSGITEPPSPTLSYSSGIAHYTESTNNTFTYVLTVTNASGDMYTSSTLLSSDGNGNAFANPGNKSYTDFAGGTNPPVQNYGVGTGVTCLISNVPRNIHTTATTNKFTRYDVTTPYGSHNNQRINYTPNINVMGSSATTSQVDEDNILISSLGTGSGNAIRVDAGATGDNPSPVSTTFNSSATPAVYEAIVRGGTLRHDQTNYSDGSYMPVGLNLSSGRSGTQYFQVLLTRTTVSQFTINVTGSYAGCKVCMPENSTWTTGLSNTNGWADMFSAYGGSGVPRNVSPGCAQGGSMNGSSGSFQCVFGTETSSNGNGKILVRFKLTSGQSITNISFSS
jgi:hypothetical protein